jgi:hypothetical protein
MNKNIKVIVGLALCMGFIVTGIVVYEFISTETAKMNFANKMNELAKEKQKHDYYCGLDFGEFSDKC